MKTFFFTAIQNYLGIPIPSGSQCILTLSQNATTGTNVVAQTIYNISIDNTGSASQSIWFNDELYPAGTYYNVVVKIPNFGVVYDQDIAITGASYNLATFVPDSQGTSSGVTVPQFQTNGTANTIQTLLNIKSGTNINVTSDAAGGVTINATATPTFVYIGVLSGLPATATVGQLAFVTNAAAGQNIYECTATNTWSASANPQFTYIGPLSGIPATAVIGQICFITDAAAGRNIYECTATNIWTQQTGALTSVFGRTGIVTAQTGDYTVAKVTGAAPLASPAFTGVLTIGGSSGFTYDATNQACSIAVGGTATSNQVALITNGGSITAYAAPFAFTPNSFINLTIPPGVGAQIWIGTNETSLIYSDADGSLTFHGFAPGGSFQIGCNPTTATAMNPVYWPAANATAGQVLTSDGGSPKAQLSWTTPTAAPVSSVFTRTGAVIAVSGDYTVAQVTGAAPLASPGLTGVPTAPTASPLTGTTQLATTNYSDLAVGVEKARSLAAEALLAPLTSAHLVTPLLGTPTSGTLTNCTGLPAAAVVAGTFPTGMILVAPQLGTPASGIRV
jgi:hypothetical protein